tara:strand:+ start:5565 stop:6221 length:657 start_codon:yes stop_codon:yes gene_type:complete
LSITQNLKSLYKELPEDVKLVAVSKTKPGDDILEAYEAGQRIFGENKVQEMTAKHEALPKDIQWHMIGHLQSNKVKYIVPYVSLIHSVDRLKLFNEINRQANRFKKQVHVLLQVKIAEEDSKFGMPMVEATRFFEENLGDNYPHVTVVGLMGMATFTDDESQLKKEFNALKSLFDTFGESHDLKYLSMGMSGDYEVAISCGSNMVRVGSAIFGKRNYD